MTVTLKPITSAIGVEVAGVQVACMDDRDFAAIPRALLDHLVIVLHDQQLSPEDHLAFARRFGELEPPHPVFAHLADHPEVSVLETRGNEGIYNDEWHTDVTFRAQPALGSILYARIIPENGGDTLWASMYAAYEALSPAIKRGIEGLSAIHDICGGGPYGRTANFRE